MGYPTYPRPAKYQKKWRSADVRKKKDIPAMCQYPKIITMFNVADLKRDMSVIFTHKIIYWCVYYAV